MDTRVITGGTVVTATQTFKADIRVEEGRIAAVAQGLPTAGLKTIDASGCFVLPGGVDVHTHFDLTVNGLKVADGFETGTISAICGGTTTIVEHPGFTKEGSLFTPFSQTQEHALNHAVTDYGIHGVVSRVDENTATDIHTLIKKGVPSVKVYTTYAGRLEKEGLATVLAAMGKEKGLVAVHAEDHDAIGQLTAKLQQENRVSPPHHPISRPDWCEAKAIEELIALSRAANNAPLYIVHLSTKAGLEVIRKAKAQGLPIYAETCPQYLLLTDENYNRTGNEALQFVMSPPLRKQKDCDALWAGLADGTIDTVATDHCYFSLQQKTERGSRTVFECPGGIPGAETRLVLLWSEGVAKNRLTMNRFVELVSTAPAQIMGLAPAKGDIAIGADADIVIWNPTIQRTLSAKGLAHQGDYTPFADIIVTGWPQTVLLRGIPAVKDNTFIGHAGMGRYIPRTLNTDVLNTRNTNAPRRIP